MAFLQQQQQEAQAGNGLPGPEMKLKFLQYAQSNRCVASSDSSVSYAAAALTIHWCSLPSRVQYFILQLRLLIYALLSPGFVIYCRIFTSIFQRRTVFPIHLSLKLNWTELKLIYN